MVSLDQPVNFSRIVSDAADVVYSMATVANMIIWLVPVMFRLCAGNRWVPGPFYTGRYSWTISLFAVLCTLYFLVTRCFPATANAVPIATIVAVGTLFVSLTSFFVYGKRFTGLDEEVLKLWRAQASSGEEDTMAFTQVLQESTRDSPSA